MLGTVLQTEHDHANGAEKTQAFTGPTFQKGRHQVFKEQRNKQTELSVDYTEKGKQDIRTSSTE